MGELDFNSWTDVEDSLLNILIIEDNLSHLNLTKYALEKNNLRANYHSVRDGQEALDYLFRKGQYGDAQLFPLPDIILLDLNLPKRDGRELLQVLQADESLKKIPVIVVSTSDRPEDMSFALQLGAVAYISKSLGFEKFNESFSLIRRYVNRA